MVQRTEKDKPARIRGWRRFSRTTMIVVGVVVVVLVLARLAMPYVLRNAINHRLEKIPDYTGWVDDVGVSLYRGAYIIHGIVIQKRNGPVSVPYFRADRIDFSLAWRELFHRRFVSDMTMEKPEMTLIAGKTHDVAQIADYRWQEVIKDLFPIDITWLKVTDGQLRYINANSTPKVDVRVAHLQALASGLRNRADEEGNEFPATIVLQGETIGGGHLKIATQLEPLALEPHFLLKLEVEKVSLPALNEFLQAYGGIDVSKGEFSVYVETVARDGHFNGYFKPFFDHVDFSQPPGDKRNIKQEVWELFVSTFATIFKNHPRDEVATRIPFTGEFKNLDVHVWESVKNLVRHAFVHPLLKKLDNKAIVLGSSDPGGAPPKAKEPGKAAAKVSSPGK